ncbi:hypothetical protein DAKH74_023720 [Maudiozyma humilis]|uniref:DUF3533 domain-containing protein n=1 Tax=Maudiozyma humilis TaxID=51915 RepID=A0AAV5RWE5_MAUHU|nr:hypothetical protein DAKH74_023720 [Kazachstania humilis]
MSSAQNKDIEKQATTEEPGLVVQNESGILGEMVNLSNHFDQAPGEDAEQEYQNRNSIIYNVPEDRPLADIDEDNLDAISNSARPSINSSEAPSVESFNGDNNSSSIRKTDSNESKNTIAKTATSLTKIQTRYFSPRLHNQRKHVVMHFGFTLLVFAVFIFTVFTLFWGSNAYTVKYYPRIKLLAVIQDDVYTPEMVAAGIVPLSTVLASMIPLMPGKWSVFNTTSFSEKYNVSGTQEIDDKITERIYHEYYWVSINVRPNVTAKLYESIVNTSAPAFNYTEMLHSMYESGRDPTNMKTAILPIMEGLETAFTEYYTENYLPSLLENITAAQPNITFNMKNIASAGRIGFGYTDYRPFYRRGLITPAQIGIIYGLILTVFQFLVYTPLHMEMAKYLNAKNYIIYRVLISFVTFFFTSLFYCTVSAMFGFDFTKAFGRGGFVIYWMSAWLYMLACGGANENVVSLIFLYKPQFLGFWILSFVILNLGPSFFPMALDNVVYRYGYMMPIHNAVGIFRVIFMDTSRRHMGRNYGVLVAWIVLNTALQPFVIRYVGSVNKKRQLAAAAAAAAAANPEPVEEKKK